MFEEPPKKSLSVYILWTAIVLLVFALVYQTMSSNGGRNTTVSPSSSEAPQEPISEDPPPSVIRSGEKIERTVLKNRGVRLLDPLEVDPIEQDRVRRSVEERMIYDSLLTWRIYGKVEDRKWGTRAVVNLSYGGEANLVRTVEKNDGDEIVVVYEFRSIRSIEILCDVETIKLDFMKTYSPIVTAAVRLTTAKLAPILDAVIPGTGTALFVAGFIAPIGTQAFLEKVGRHGYEFALEYLKFKDRIKIFATVDSLEGKKVRLTHRNGAVEVLEPIDCELKEAERNFCMNLGVLADYHIMPDLQIKPGEKWKVRADQFSSFLDPSLRGIPHGTLEITRKKADNKTDDIASTTLEILGGTIELDTSDPKTSRLGRCMPRGTIQYDAEEGFVRGANLRAEISIDRASKDHMLFETRFKSHPMLEIEYECSKDPR